MPDVRPRISPALARDLTMGATLHGLPTIGAYLDQVVRPMVRADIARRLAIDPSLAQLSEDVVAPIAAPPAAGADVDRADVAGGSHE